jgi:phage/plasmid-like protein (TIGR03299 family)|tara:strand:+ start:4407 stop:5357 length:951 start_codon:yes stop_codon:yes gene_type:complete
MSHELEIVNGEAQMAYTGEVPWHGLGVKVEESLSPAEFQKAAGLDWNVVERPVYAEFNGNKITSGHKMLIRETDAKPLTIITGDWNPVQNSEAFEFFNEFCEVGAMKMETAGSLKGGQWVWALAKMTDTFELFGGDSIEGYLLFSNPHIYGRGIDIQQTLTRVVCNNTINVALQGASKNKVRFNHRRVFDADLAKELLGLAADKMESFKAMAQFLGTRSYKDEIVADYFDEVFPGYSKKTEDKKSSKNALRAFEVLETQPGAEYAKGTWWQALNAATYLVDHEIGKSQESRLISNFYGSNKQLKTRALEKALEYAS